MDFGIPSSGTSMCAGIMVEGTRVRDLLPIAPARLSGQIAIDDIIVAVDGQEANQGNVLQLLRGSDQGNALDLKLLCFTWCICSRVGHATFLLPSSYVLRVCCSAILTEHTAARFARLQLVPRARSNSRNQTGLSRLLP